MLVSVYMPTRNRVNLLGKAIDSVFAQTCEAIELIVVNDASSDGTAEYLRKRAQDEPRLVHLTNTEPRGAPASRNIAIRKSKGAFVTGLDDDDEFLPERVTAFVEYWNLLTSKGVQPSCLYAQDIWLSNGAVCHVSQKRGSVNADDLFRGNDIGNQIFAPRAHFIDAGLFDEQLPVWQDFELFIRIAQQFGTAHLLDMATYLGDVTVRPDRISLQEQRIRAAFEIVSKKHSLGVAWKEKALFLRLIGDGSRVSPTPSDWIRVLRWGLWPKGVFRLLRATLAGNKKYLRSLDRLGPTKQK
jgi:glycosyltransferase involved in cell wall biosynthesis